jgi:hypothetical protein
MASNALLPISIAQGIYTVVVHCHDIRVDETSRDPRFPLETLRTSALIIRQIDDLHRNGALKIAIGRRVDGAHAASANQAPDLVAPTRADG